ncbi:MAG: hypothetical protein JXB04_03400 [Kiritimatiellae bacterium]|nr:hypothetical protein [Kiritimatiellia bacterium]
MSPLEKIAVLQNEVEAKLLESTLRDRAIPFLIKAYHDSALDGVFQSQLGWGHVEAAREHREEILAILADLQTEGSGPVSETS